MTLQITNSLLSLNDSIVIFISVCIFIAVSLICGIITYKIKIKQIRQNNEKDKDNRT